MNERIENYINELFKNAPKTPQTEEVKNEIIGNTIEKFNELKLEGKDDEAAFNIAVSHIGNVSELIDEYAKDEDAMAMRDAVQKHKEKQALLLSVAVALYILCVVPVIMLAELGLEILGICLMFIMVAVATGLIIYRASTSKLYTVNSDPKVQAVTYSVPPTKEQMRRGLVRRNILSAVWAVIVALYLLISFLTGAWHITWIIFIIGGVVDNLLKAVFDYFEWNDIDDKEDD